MQPRPVDALINVRALLDGYSIEALPSAVSARQLLPLPLGTHVYLPSIPGSDPAEQVVACRTLVAQGFRPVPHVAARSIADERSLDQHLSQLSQSGADALLLIAGDGRRPAGRFSDTMDVLSTGLLEANGFTRLGIAGHPEGHAVASADAVARALEAKADYAARTGAEMWIVSQFAFSADPIADWLQWLHRQEVALSVKVGVAGPAGLRKLIAYAVRCGIGNSVRFLTDRPGKAASLIGNWTPDELVFALANVNVTRHGHCIAGIHFYPFGGIAAVNEWLQSYGVGGSD
ncbi:MAG: methylenetetrahydrofolate reductase [Pseudomonadota bacterium]